MAKPKDKHNDPRYSDWYAAYIEDVRERVKHWGDKRVHCVVAARDGKVLDVQVSMHGNPSARDGETGG